MSDMVEKVKAALIAEDQATGSERHMKYWDDMAKAAIEAMPCGQMVALLERASAALRAVNHDSLADEIDAALSTKGE